MNACTKFHSGLFNICWDIFTFRTTNVNLMVATGKVIRIHHQLGTMNISKKKKITIILVPMCFVDDEIFHWINYNFDLLVALEKKSKEH